MLKKLIKTLFNPQPSVTTNQQWQLEIQPLVDEHQAERRAWYKEKRELHRQLAACKEQHGLCLAEVASGQHRELPLCQIADLQRTPLPKNHKDESYELIATMRDNSFRTLDVVLGSDYGTWAEMNEAMQLAKDTFSEQLSGQFCMILWKPLSND